MISEFGDPETSQGLLGVDIGGTFTDIVALLPGEILVREKVPSTPDNFARGVASALSLAESGVDIRSVAVLAHGTTVATNAILEGHLGEAAFLTTRGFRDVLAIGRTKRPNFYDLEWDKPAPAVPRRRVMEVDERVGAGGEILMPLDAAQVREIVEGLAADGVRFLAIGFVNSYANPVHEREAAAIARDILGQDNVSVSTELVRELKEYERFSTVTINAALLPTVRDYLREVSDELARRDFAGRFLVMQSNGGLLSAEQAEKRPAALIESGPAAGVLAAKHLAESLGLDRCVSLDVGGTTAKACLIEDGEVAEAPELDVGGGMNSTLQSGGGLPVRLPAFEISEVGAGGGSIAWVDDAGALRVGPESAGAAPGPACYGKGGVRPTVTDAWVVLGYLDEDSGDLSLSRTAAEDAIRGFVADPLGLDVVAAAAQICEVANSNMGRALRSISVEKGRDPRDYALIAFGGAGGLHAASLAAETGFRRVIAPAFGGVFSALGMLTADVRVDATRTYIAPVSDVDWSVLRAQVAESEAELREQLVRSGADAGSIAFSSFLDVRYRGQTHEVRIPIDLSEADDALGDAVVSSMAALYARDFGYVNPTAEGEVVAVRVRGRGGRRVPQVRDVAAERVEPPRVRSVYFGVDRGWHETAVYAGRGSLPASVAGPAIVEEPDTTILVPPGWDVVVIDGGALSMEPSGTSVDSSGTGSRRRSLPPLAVVRNMLEAITDEMALTVVRTAHSLTASEQQDFSAALCNADAEIVSQGLGVLNHLGSASAAVRALRQRFGDRMSPGDVFVLNDPYHGGTHLPDFIVIRPIFGSSRLLGFALVIAHQTDVGGGVAGGHATGAEELYQEGLILPPIRLVNGGVTNEDVFDLIARNVRVPEEVLGDLHAQMAACEKASEQFLELVERYGEEPMGESMEMLLSYAERLTRAQIAKLTPGVYTASDFLDDDGVSQDAVPLRVALRVGDGSLVADFTGSSSQRKGGLNAVPGTSLAAVHYGLRSIVGGDIPDNGGVHRCISLVLPAGSIVNPDNPAPVAARGLTAFRLGDVVMRALAQVAPDRVGAAGDGGPCVFTLGERRSDGSYHLLVDTSGGAGGGRPRQDGLAGVAAAIGNVRNTPIEVIEQRHRVRIETYGFLPSGGHGQFRGGPAIVREYHFLGEEASVFCRTDRRRFPPWGLRGGEDGSPSALHLIRSGEETLLPSKVVLKLEHGDRIRITSAGGGGWGPADLRSREAIRADIEAGFVAEGALIDEVVV